MKRSAPMKRTSFARKSGSPFSSLANRGQMKRRAKERATAAEREQMCTVVGLYCIVCTRGSLSYACRRENLHRSRSSWKSSQTSNYQ
ncbi:MAG TPA: hypothetical protein VJU59_27295 [Paraburkholderia sp.]|uniref:hypothetical protein n=1 Tax=Paraburkholderia sp. TaxID=1926495 RepID=UPI002B4715F9|nr:hypothetical protein [Paraburkholderia sp.]HKR43345.1 hypothetical protein [Paraburkholderia sp.]